MCRRELEKFPLPRWEIADLLGSTLGCTTTADAPVKTTECTCQKCPIAPSLPCLTLAQLRPTLRSTTGSACRKILEKIPSPRWDFHMFGACLCLQGGGVAVWGGTVTFSSCTITGNTASHVRAHVQNFPSPDGIFTCFALCACRAAVYTSTVAR